MTMTATRSVRTWKAETTRWLRTRRRHAAGLSSAVAGVWAWLRQSSRSSAAALRGEKPTAGEHGDEVPGRRDRPHHRHGKIGAGRGSASLTELARPGSRRAASRLLNDGSDGS